MTEPEYVSRPEAVRQLGISMSTADRWFNRSRGVYRDRCQYVPLHPRATRWLNVLVPVALIHEINEARQPK